MWKEFEPMSMAARRSRAGTAARPEIGKVRGWTTTAGSELMQAIVGDGSASGGAGALSSQGRHGTVSGGCGKIWGWRFASAGGPILVTEPNPSRPERLEDRMERAEISNLPNLLNRELSWLEFNARVLREAEDPDNPLLERLKFIAIFDSNLDEFFMKRVGGLKQQLPSNVRELGPDRGGPPRQQLAAINAEVRPMV